MINEYESGKAIPNGAIINKLSLGTILVTTNWDVKFGKNKNNQTKPEQQDQQVKQKAYLFDVLHSTHSGTRRLASASRKPNKWGAGFERTFYTDKQYMIRQKAPSSLHQHTVTLSIYYAILYIYIVRCILQHSMIYIQLHTNWYSKGIDIICLIESYLLHPFCHCRLHRQKKADGLTVTRVPHRSLKKLLGSRFSPAAVCSRKINQRCLILMFVFDQRIQSWGRHPGFHTHGRCSLRSTPRK